MKKLISTKQFIFILLMIMLLIPWNENIAKSGCDKILHQTFCKNSITITPDRISEKPVQEILPGAFPFDNLIIKI